MKPCEQQQNIALYVDGELSGKELAQFESHLAQCPACQEELEQVRELLRQLNDLPELEVPAQLPARLRAALLEEAGKARIRSPRPTWLPMAAAVCAILVGGVILVGGALRMGQTGGNSGGQYLMQAEQAPASDEMNSIASVPEESAALATDEAQATSEAPRLAAAAPQPSDQGGKLAGGAPAGDATEEPAAGSEQTYGITQSEDGDNETATAKVQGGKEEATAGTLEDNANLTDAMPEGEQTVWNHIIDWCMGALPWVAAALLVGGLATVVTLSARRARSRRSGKE